MKIELNEQFEFPDDNGWGRSFWKGFAVAVATGAVIAVALIRLGAYVAERWYG